MDRRIWVSALATLVLGAAGVVGVAAPAQAATTTGWASWQPLTGSSGAFTTGMQFGTAPGLTATVRSDSRSGQVGVISGSSTWLSAGTPVGAKYGSSRDKPYLNLRPKADTATAPSTTTYSFPTPTPTSGWAFVLGDIDADQVRVTALGPTGAPLTADQLGFRGAFNYCSSAATGGVSCPKNPDGAPEIDLPSWDATTTTLTGNEKALDTSGASGWFEPSAPISSLTFTFARRSGLPIYQTWFASLGHDISGVVTDQGTGPLPGATLNLLDAEGDVIGTTTSGADGSYRFSGYTAADGYTVALVTPDGKIGLSPSRVAVDISQADVDDADFAVRQLIPVAVSGRVVDGDGQGVADVPVEIDGPDGPLTTVTDAVGNYVFDQVPVGDHTISVTPPAGYDSTVESIPVSVPPNSEVPIPGQDFVITALPTVSGSVTAGGEPVEGAVITAQTSGGTTISTVTAADGSYHLDAVPSGDYTVSVEPPDGYLPVGATSIDTTVAAEDVAGVDFSLARPGVIGGVVSDGAGDPLPGIALTVDTPDGPVDLVTDADGSYAIDGLAPGGYVVTVHVPDGDTAIGATEQAVTITAAGEAFADLDFAIAVPTPPTGGGGGPGTGTGTPGGAGSTGSGSAGSGSSGRLASSGSDVAGLTPFGLAALLAIGLGSAVRIRIRLRHRRRRNA